MSTALMKRSTATACGCTGDTDPAPRKRGKQSNAGIVALREAALRKIISDKDAQIAALRAQLKASINRGRDAR
jgi:hypothetical protein